MENTELVNEVKLMKEEDIKKAYDANDINIINGVLAGTIKVEKQEIKVPQEEVKTEMPVVDNATITVEETKTTEESEFLKQKHEEEKNRLRHFFDEEERKHKEVEDLNVAQTAALTKQVEEEKKKREELEVRIRELSEKKQEQDSVYTDDEDGELVSSYAKNTRKMIEGLKAELVATSKNNPEYLQLKERIHKFEEVEAARIQQVEKEKADRKAKEAEERVLGDIKSFQNKYPELQTSKDYAKLAEEFGVFKSSLAKFANATAPKDIDRVLMTFFDESKGQKMRESAAKVGILPPEEIEKFVGIAELVDMTRGVEYDPVLERFVQIKNQFGEPVRYRSIEESYKVKHYYDEINNAKRNVVKKISNKLTNINQSPVTLDNSETASIENGLNNDQVSQIIRDAEAYVYDKSKYNLLERAYARIGQSPPAYKGK